MKRSILRSFLSGLNFAILTGKGSIYTLQLCRMWQSYAKSTTLNVLCKTNLQLTCDYRARHEKMNLVFLKRILLHRGTPCNELYGAALPERVPFSGCI